MPLADPPVEAKATRHRVALPRAPSQPDSEEPADASLRLRTPAACKQRRPCYRQSGNTGIGRIAYLAGWVGRKDARLLGRDDRGRAIGYLELAEDVADVMVNRAHADA